MADKKQSGRAQVYAYILKRSEKKVTGKHIHLSQKSLQMKMPHLTVGQISSTLSQLVKRDCLSRVRPEHYILTDVMIPKLKKYGANRNFREALSVTIKGHATTDTDLLENLLTAMAEAEPAIRRLQELDAVIGNYKRA